MSKRDEVATNTHYTILYYTTHYSTLYTIVTLYRRAHTRTYVTFTAAVSIHHRKVQYSTSILIKTLSINRLLASSHRTALLYLPFHLQLLSVNEVQTAADLTCVGEIDSKNRAGLVWSGLVCPLILHALYCDAK